MGCWAGALDGRGRESEIGSRGGVWAWCTETSVFSEPSGARVSNVLQDAPILTEAQSSRRTRRTSLPRVGVTIHIPIIDVKVRLSNVLVKEGSRRSSIVTNEFSVETDGEFRCVARSKRFVLSVTDAAKVCLGHVHIEASGLQDTVVFGLGRARGGRAMVETGTDKRRVRNKMDPHEAYE